MPLSPIETPEDLEAALDALCAADPRLGRLRAGAGDIPLRRTAPSFAALAEIIVAQQISRAAADAILGRLRQAAPDLSPSALLQAGEAGMRAAGLSRPKQRTLLALADAAMADTLGLHGLSEMEADDAVTALCALPGIGPWTAEVYLLAATGHPDVFPAGDVALQAAVAHAFALPARPTRAQLAALAESWSPWRAAAARLLWAHYAVMRGRDGAPAAITPNIPQN